MAVTFSLSAAAAGMDSPTTIKADENTWATRIVAADELTSGLVGGIVGRMGRIELV